MKSDWLYNKTAEIIFILFPPFFAVSVATFFQKQASFHNEVNIIAWIFLVLCIDVAHVYSTLFRTYFNKSMREKKKSILILIPIVAWVIGAFIFSLSPTWFWRIVAYLAVYHFIRQQYGFFQIYARNEHKHKGEQLINSLAIYSATLLPILIWHFRDDRKFAWMQEGDFLLYPNAMAESICLILLFIIQSTYLIKELYISYLYKKVNIPKNAVWLGTVLSWYMGIIYYNGDFTFTITNVLAHGIPYMALIWITEKKEKQKLQSGFLKKIYTFQGIFIFLFILILFAYFEEGLWNSLIWNDEEKAAFFYFFDSLPTLQTQEWLGFVVPLLTLPQLTHYILDGFIWRLRKKDI